MDGGGNTAISTISQPASSTHHHHWCELRNDSKSALSSHQNHRFDPIWTVFGLEHMMGMATHTGSKRHEGG